MSAKFLVALLPLLAPFATGEPATFTHYGSGDGYGSQNCANPPSDRPLACGAGTTNVQGYTAAISQNAYGAGPGAGAGPGCGKCFTLSIDEDENGSPITQKTINVTVNNLCPAQGNEEWCDIPNGGTNKHGGQVHFDICSDNGGSEAFFTSVGAGKGTASEIPCGGGNAAESSSALASSAQPTSPATSAPAGGASSAPYSSASSPSSAAGSESSSAPSSGSSSGAGSGSPYQGGSASSAAGAQTTPPSESSGSGGSQYTPSLHSHPFPSGSRPSFSLPGGASGSPGFPHITPHHRPTPTPGAGHHPSFGAGGASGAHGHHSGSPYQGGSGSNTISAQAAQSSDECPEESKKSE